MKKSAQVDDDIRDEFDILQEQLSKTSSELRGKKFAVDSTGRAIGIAPMKSESLPPYSLYPSHNISSYDREKEKSEKPNAGKKGGRKRISGADKESSASTSPSYPHFLPTPSLATSLSSHAAIPLAPGVSLKSRVIVDTTSAPPGSLPTQKPTAPSPVTREGPNLPSDPKKLSRSEYFAKQQSVSRMASLTSSTDKSESLFIGESFSEYSTTGKGQTLPASLNGTTSSSRGTLQSAGGVKTNRYLDLNPLEGGREIDREKERLAEEEKAREELEREYEREREKLLAGERGARGGVSAPHKPSTKQKQIVGQLHGSQYLAGPRDRLSTFALDSRRKHVTYAGDGGVEGSGSLHGGSTSSAMSGTAGGSIKRERADLAREIFR